MAFLKRREGPAAMQRRQEKPMKTTKIKFATILLGLVMALSLIPGFAVAANTGTDAQDNAASTGLLPTAIRTAQLMQANDGKPSQVIQAAYLPSFKTDTGKNLNAKVVEGNGALSYAVKSGGDCVSVDPNGALTFSKAGEAIVTVTAAETNEYAETSIDVPIKIYDHFDYTFTVGNTIECVDYYGYYHINKLEIKLKNGNTVVGSATINSPQKGSSTTISATGFANKIEMTAEIQMRNRTRSASKTLDLNGGGRFEIEVTSRGTIVMCDYGITLPEPDYVAPVAKPNLTATGNNQLLIYPGSVLSGGQHMEYAFGNAEAPNSNGWTDNYGFMRAKDPGDYYVWWKTASRDRRSLMYFSGGRLDTAPQCMKVTIGKGNINPTVSIDGWTYGEEPKAPTVTGNTGNGAVTYEYKAKGAVDSTYSKTVPTDAGDYTVRATIEDTTTHYGGTATADFTIAKAAMPDQSVRIVGYMGTNDQEQAWVGSFTKSLAGMMPDGAGVSAWTAGTPTYQVNGSAATWPEGFSFTTAPSVTSDGDFSATLQITKQAAEAIADVDQVGEFTVPVTVTSDNYNDATINVIMAPTARTEKTVTIEGTPTSKTYGNDAFTLTATVDDEGATANDWYWYSSDPKVLEVANTGSKEMTITIKGAGSAQIMAWYEPADSNRPYIGAAVTNPIKVSKATFTPSVTLAGWTYGGTANAPVVSNIPEGVSKEIQENNALTVTYEYKAKEAADSTYTTAVPTLAGDYTVRATVPETTNYLSAICTADFTIARKQITATVTALDKTYDGTTDGTAIATVEKSDLVESDLDDAALVEDGKVAISGVTCTFIDENAGESKEVILNYDKVTSPVANADSYEVTVAATPTAAIKPLTVNVGAADKSSPYGQAIAELTYGLYGPNGLVGDDTLESLGVTATTEALSTSNVGYYPIKLSGGTSNGNYKVTLGGDATYTITKVDPAVTAPEAANPTYSGSPQALVTAGAVEGGEIQYSLDGKTFSTNMPVGTDAGEYAVWYKVIGDANHNDATPQKLTSTIAKATIPTQAVRVVGLLSSTDTEWVTTKTQPLASMMPSDAGTLTYTAGDPVYKGGGTTPPDGVTFTSSVDSSSGVVTAEVKISSSAEDIPESAQEITVPVTVKSEKNYNDAVINVVMVPTKKTEKTVSITNTPTAKTYGDGTFTLTATAKNKDTGTEVQTQGADWYWYSSDPSVLEVSEQGGNSATVTVKGAGSAQIMAWYEPNGGNAIGAAVTDSITVNKAAIEPSVKIAGWTYGGAANAPVVSGNTSGGAVACSYIGTTAGGTAFGPSAAPPAQAGSYIVTATVAETANYEGAACTAGFTVAKRGITATVTAEDKTYDGTTNATVTATVDANDLAPSDLGEDTPVEGGKVEIPGLAGTFADKNIGEDKAVGLDYSGVVSPVAEPANYDVTISRAPTATITPRPVSVRADDKSSQYGQAIATLTYGPYDGTSLAEGDTVESLGIAASTTATSSSKVGEYPIALAGGTGNANYEVTLGEDATYTIAAADISKATVTLAQTSYTYDGKAKEPAVKSVTLNGKTLVAGTDYGVSYENNVEAGTATATVTGKGNYAGEAYATFAIEQPLNAMYRLYNPNSGEHFYTASKDERDYVVAAGWTDEGVGWTAPAKSDSPVYRLYNPNAGEHHYTLSADERDMLIAAGWNDEGTGWYSDDAKAVALYREYNPNQFSCNHNFTADEDEHAHLVSLGWRDEGIAWYGVKPATAAGALMAASL